jgi:hypothetical protein
MEFGHDHCDLPRELLTIPTKVFDCVAGSLYLNAVEDRQAMDSKRRSLSRRGRERASIIRRS